MSVPFFSTLLTCLLSVSTGQLPLPSQNFTEFPGNDGTQITQVIMSICFLEDAQWGEVEDRANHPTVRKRSGRSKKWKEAGTTFQNHSERASESSVV